MQNADKAFLLGRTLVQLGFYNLTRTNPSNREEIANYVEFLKGYANGYAKALQVDLDVDAIVESNDPLSNTYVWRARIGSALAGTQIEQIGECFDLGSS